MTGAPASTVLTDKGYPLKRRRRVDGSENAVDIGDNRGSKPSKEERREAKRLKRSAKAPRAGQEVNGFSPNDKDGSALEKAATNGNKSKGKLSKESRKEAKRLERLLKEQEKGLPAAERLPAAIGANGLDIASEQSSRKAEKARLKAEKKASKLEGINAGSQSNATNDTSKSNPGYVEDPALTALSQSDIDDFLSTNFITISDPVSSHNLRPITKFSQLPTHTMTSSSPFATFKSPTPIQSAAWPFLLSGRDVIGVAETGSGKTLAFGVPCIRSITNSSRTKGSPARAVIVSPTRELAAQIHTQIEALAAPANLSTVCVYGGVPKDPQRLALKSAHIIVATPGRLNDLINENSADLSNVKYLVLDE